MIRSFGLVIVIAIAGLFGFAQHVRRSSMFFPDRFPLGDWDTSSLPVKPEEHFIEIDGERLHAWLFRAAGRGDPPLLVFCHGNAGNITGRAPLAAQLALRGVSVLLFDWRGYGKSSGRPNEDALFRDALAAYDFADKKIGAKQIVMYGESLGGPYAAYVATKRRVPAVVIENSFPSLRKLGNYLYRPFPLGWTAPFALTTSKWLNEAGKPVLVMHGRRDEVIPYSLGQALYDDLRVPKQFLTSDTAGHCELASAEGQRYYNAITEFITRYD
jgi:uncharacterized protein